MLLHRKNDSRDASSRSRHAERRAGRHLRRLALEPEEELRIDEHARHRALDAELERLLPPGAIELEQRVDARRWRRPPAGDRRASPAWSESSVAQGNSSAGDAGVQISNRRRLGVSPAPSH